MPSLYTTLKTLMQERIVVKSTAKIIASALVILIFASSIAISSSNSSKRKQVKINIEQLASTVEYSASIAAFTTDTQLANEVSKGLLSNHIVKKVIISSQMNDGIHILANMPAGTDLSQPIPHIKTLHSPFDKAEQVGELKIWLNEEFVAAQASTFAKLTTLIILAILICITALLSLVIYHSITKPIKSIADEIHHLNLKSDDLLSTPKNHDHDEVGRLVSDANQMISHLKTLIKSEHHLYVQHASAEQQLRMIFEQSQTGMFVINSSLNVTSSNPALISMLDLKHGVIHKQDGSVTLKTLFPTHYDKVKDKIEMAKIGGKPLKFTLIFDQKDKKNKWLEISLLAIDNYQIQGIVNDVTSHKIAELKAIKIAERDPLTQLLNRRGFEPKLDSLMQHAATLPTLALLVIDLDGFKPINDNFGHDAGDYVLKLISSQLLDSVRKDDLVARLGGDEFAIVLDSDELPELAYRVAKIIVKQAAKPIQYNGHTLSIGASIGIAISNEGSPTSTLLIKHADEAMYMAKQAGKSRYHLYNS